MEAGARYETKAYGSRELPGGDCKPTDFVARRVGISLFRSAADTTDDAVRRLPVRCPDGHEILRLQEDDDAAPLEGIGDAVAAVDAFDPMESRTKPTDFVIFRVWIVSRRTTLRRAGKFPFRNSSGTQPCPSAPNPRLWRQRDRAAWSPSIQKEDAVAWTSPWDLLPDVKVVSRTPGVVEPSESVPRIF